jgi:hypothetical protein
MGGLNKTGLTNHDAALSAAESVRQSAVAGVAQSPAGQITQNNAEIQWARSCIASCKANNNSQGMEPYIALLRSLGVNS